MSRLDDTQPLVNVFSKMQSLSKMMPAVQDFERRLGILKQVEPVIENAIKQLSKAIDLKGSPLAGVKQAPPPKKEEEPDMSLDGLAEAASAPAEAPGGIDMSMLLAQLGGGAAAAPEPEAAGGIDLSALLGAAQA